MTNTAVRPFLMFEGKAEEAMNFYVSLFPSAKVHNVERYGAGGPGKPGTVMRASFSIAGQTVMCTDSPISHKFTFTPSFSFWVDCESEEELNRLFIALSSGGAVLMPLNNYGFSKKFAWLSDKFGVSWQLNLP
jgi:predicted 3-demethylubiquinone-9 3-methyltransferase (glyoxalase superfamily)